MRPRRKENVCGHCKKKKEPSEFSFNQKTNKQSNWCKACHRLYWNVGTPKNKELRKKKEEAESELKRSHLLGGWGLSPDEMH